MVNNVTLVGRLAADPEIRYLPDGIAVGKLRLAVQRPKRQDRQDSEADFIDVVVWRRQAEVCAENLNKGSLVGVEGRIQVRDYTDSHGQKRKAFEVVARMVHFLGRPAAGGGGSNGRPASKTDIPNEIPEADYEEVPF